MGVFEQDKGSGVWWVRYTGADGKIHREKVGQKSVAKQIYLKRKNQVREEHDQSSLRLPSKLRWTSA